MAIGNLCSFLKLYNFTNRKWNTLFPYRPFILWVRVIQMKLRLKSH